MAQGFSGGFFLPAQRSVHCKGGFFSSATRATATTASTRTAATRAPAPFPVLFTLPQVPSVPADHTRDDPKPVDHPKSRGRRVYDPEEGDEDCALAEDRCDERRQLEAETPVALQRSASTATRFVRCRQQQHQQSRKQESAEPRGSSSRSNNASSREASRTRPRQGAGRDRTQEKEAERPEKGDINTKFEIAMKEFNQIKDEFDLKNQRQHSAPILPVARVTSSTAKTPQSKNSKSPAPELISTTSPNQHPEPQDTAVSEEAPSRNMQSPRQRLQVAEMVMRKLYKKNLQTEQELAAVKADKEQLAKKLAAFESGPGIDTTSSPLSTQPPMTTLSPSSSAPCQRCAMNSAVGFVLANPPTMETVSRIDQQQLEYLRHLAAEQDRTITSLKVRIEDLSKQLMTSTSRQPQTTGKTTGGGSKGKSSTSTPRQTVTKLQSKLQDALSESERQKSNYLKLKRDFQHLLALKTKTLYENPAQLHTSARELVALMDKQLKQLEAEHSMNLSLYNSKLYESEQQSCESYAQQRLLEEEMDRVARDVQHRDALDVEIEQCMANVFERLHQVESENVNLKNAIISTHKAS